MDTFNTLTEIIRNRRAVFPSVYTGETVENRIIEEILENANWAPTHKFTEPWRFMVFTGDSLKSLSDYMGDYYRNNTPAENFSQHKFEKTIKKPLVSSHVIALCMKRDEKKSVPEWEEIAALSCAVQNMWLSCTAAGLGCYWSSSGSAINASEFLRLEDGQKCYGWFFIGVPKEGVTLQGQRKPISEKVQWV